VKRNTDAEHRVPTRLGLYVKRNFFTAHLCQWDSIHAEPTLHGPTEFPHWIPKNGLDWLDSLGKWHETENIDGKVGLSFG